MAPRIRAIASIPRHPPTHQTMGASGRRARAWRQARVRRRRQSAVWAGWLARVPETWSQPRHVRREPAPSDHVKRDHTECDHEERDHEERGPAQERQPSSPRLCQTTQAQVAQSVRARGSTRAPPRWP